MSLREDAYSTVLAVQKISEPRQRRELIMRFAWVYEALTGKTLKGVPEGQDEAMILALLYKIASGEISLPDEDKEQASNIPTNLDELLESYQKAMDKGTPVDRQVIRAVIEAWIKMRKKERVAKVLEDTGVEKQKAAEVVEKIISVLEKAREQGVDKEIIYKTVIYKTLEEIAQKEGLVLPDETKTLLYEAYNSGLLPKNLVEELGVLPGRRTPIPTPENPKIEQGGNLHPEVKREPGKIKKLELLVRLSYKRPSVVNEIVNELVQIPLGISASFGATRPLLESGVGPKPLREGIEEFKRQNQGIDDNHPFIRALFSQLNNLEGLASSGDKLARMLEKYKNDVRIEILFLREGEENPLDTPTQKYIRFEIYQPRKGEPALRQVTAPFAGDSYLKTIGQEALKTTQKTLFSAVAKIIAKPFALLARVRAYLGGAFLAGALILPLPAPLRVGIAMLGLGLGWKQVSSFFTSILPGLFKNLRKISFSLFVSRGIGGLLSAIFTKPTLGWLRTTLAIGGVGSLLLPIPLPLRLVFATFGGSLGLTQAAGSVGKWGGFLSRVSLGLSRGMLFVLGGAAVPVAGWVLAAIIIGIVGVGIISYLNIQGSQKLFLTSGIAAAPQESRFIQITKSATPQNIKNEELPKTVEFTIVITAREQALTINSIKETFAALAKDKTITVPEKTPAAPKTRLAPGESTEVKFSLSFDKNFEDSAITATTVVSASVDGHASAQTASASTTVIVGSPPTSCLVFDDRRLPWQDGAASYRSWVIQAIAYIFQSQAYTANLCGKGLVFLERGRSSLDVGDKDDVAGLAPAALGNRVYLFEKAFTGYLQLRYVLAHELGHIYAYRNGGAFRSFETTVNPQSDPKKGEAFLKTYSLVKSVGEDFPETIALYMVWGTTSIGNYGIVNMPMEYPKHHNFARQQIFGLFQYK